MTEKLTNKRLHEPETGRPVLFQPVVRGLQLPLQEKVQTLK